ncbi:MAG: UTP--glucose-1-phosphate uridylyltransferase [Rhodospirillaceae bacterium]|jgi:UTP--glucose-1-phosphate uridylyltransferase|nr:UTP--glucose-1-phosphate uridylyltransferase [Rhodospirillaceae bacterium]|tara:strand:- start:842 stop:1672 length:831 start_codon:yes stop_codon:yes gene_type:complete
MVKAVTKAVFPVAGLGTRFLPATKAIPKEMLPIVDKPLIQYAVEEALEAGIEEMVMVTAPGRSLIEDHFAPAAELEAALKARDKEAELKAIGDDFPKPKKISFTHQEQPLGLGHAVWRAREFVADGPFAVLLPDDLMQARPGCLAQMVEAYQDTGGNVVAVEEVTVELTARYGILDVEDDDGRLARARGVVEKPDPAEAPSRLAVIGRYILQPRVFDHLDKKAEGAGGEIQLTDALAAMLDKIPLHGLRIEGRRFDCGSKAGFVEATAAFAAERVG